MGKVLNVDETLPPAMKVNSSRVAERSSLALTQTGQVNVKCQHASKKAKDGLGYSDTQVYDTPWTRLKVVSRPMRRLA